MLESTSALPNTAFRSYRNPGRSKITIWKPGLIPKRRELGILCVVKSQPRGWSCHLRCEFGQQERGRLNGWGPFLNNCVSSKGVQIILKINLLIPEQVIIGFEAGKKKSWKQHFTKGAVQWLGERALESGRMDFNSGSSPCSVTLGESLNLSVFICKLGITIIITTTTTPASQGYLEDWTS